MMATKVPQEARTTDIWYDELPDAISAAVHKYDMENTSAYRSLSDLATQVQVDDVVVDSESAVIDGNQMIVSGTVYVNLIYDSTSDEPINLSESYPIRVNLSINDGDVTVDDMEADTSSFYE